MSDLHIIDTSRTPPGIGTPGQAAAAQLHPQHLRRIVFQTLVERNGVGTADSGDVVLIGRGIAPASIERV